MLAVLYIVMVSLILLALHKPVMKQLDKAAKEYEERKKPVLYPQLIQISGNTEKGKPIIKKEVA